MALALVGVQTVQAQDGEPRDKETTARVASGATIDGAYYAANQEVIIDGTVEGDVYCAAQNVVITGTIEGDLICAAQSVEFLGEVSGDLRIATQTLRVEGTVEGTATVFGQNIIFTDESTVGRDLNGAAQLVSLEGTVGRDVALGAERLTLEGTVGRNVSADVESLILSENGEVGGAVAYTSNREATVDGAVAGEVQRSSPPADRDDASDSWVIGAAVYGVLSVLLVSMLLVALAPQLIHRVTDKGTKRLGMAALVGVATLFSVPVVLVLLAITVIGLPVALLLGLVWIVVLVLSGPVFAYYLGRIIMKNRTKNALYIMLSGALVLTVVYAIPVANVIAGLITGVLGTGMLLLTIADRFERPKYQVKKA